MFLRIIFLVVSNSDIFLVVSNSDILVLRKTSERMDRVDGYTYNTLI